MSRTAVVVGLGSAGRRHAAALRAWEPELEIVAVSRSVAEPLPDVDVVVTSIDAALEHGPVVGVVAGPATTRMADAVRLADHGVHLFLEKPVAASLDGVDDLCGSVARNGVVVGVGYNLRHWAPLRAARDLVQAGRIGDVVAARAEVGQHLADWRPGVPYASSVSARAELGGGALLELSHEVDYLLWILGDVVDVHAVLANHGVLDVDVDESADLLLRFASGAVASVHQDLLQRPPVRVVRFHGTAGALEADLRTGSVVVQNPDGTADLVHHEPQELAATYVAQIADFLDAVDSGRDPEVTLPMGLATLRVLVEARASDQAWVRG